MLQGPLFGESSLQCPLLPVHSYEIYCCGDRCCEVHYCESIVEEFIVVRSIVLESIVAE
jgi:hypothetical protein